MLPLLFVLHPVPKHKVWRWAIYRVDEATMLANPRSGCINAGTQKTKVRADDIGQQCLYTILSFAALLGRNCEVKALTYDFDLVPDIPGVPLQARQLSINALQMGI